MSSPLRVPCAYQGGKQRVAKQIVDELIAAAPQGLDSSFYDLCCGSGAVSIELVNRGVDPSKIVMLDLSSWGGFWAAVGKGDFNMDVFTQLLSELPENKREMKAHLTALSSNPLLGHEAELYLILQANSFGGKQIWHDGNRWQNAFFRDYWEPTETSVRRSPANPMQPSPIELRRRVEAIVSRMRGVLGLKSDITTILEHPIPADAIVYIDPPYRSTTGYGFGLDLEDFATQFRKINEVPLFISEGFPLGASSLKLKFGGAKGGVSGTREGKHQEWLTRL